MDVGLIENFIIDKDLHPTHIYSFNAIFSDGDQKATVEALNKTQFKVAAISGLTKSKAVQFGLEDAQLIDEIRVTTTAK